MLVAVQRISPEGLTKPAAYTQVVVSRGNRMIFVSGQVAQDRDGNVVAPGDFMGQARQVFANLRIALEAAGATPADVTKVTMFIVNYRPELRPLLAEARSQFVGSGEPPASTLVGVQALADPAWLLEIEAIAVTD